MNRKACVLVLLLALPVMGAGRVSTQVVLNRKGQGDVTIEIETNLDEMKRLTASAEPLVKDSLLLREVTAAPAKLSELLSRQGMSGIGVTQSTRGSQQTTKVTAYISDVRALTGHGGELTLQETKESYLDLKGSLGGGLAGETVDLSPLADLTVLLTIEFPGTVRLKDDNAKRSHSGRAVTYRWQGDQFLRKPTTVDVRVVPDIEGTPYFWLVLILGLAGLAVLGAAIVLHRGRETLKGTSRNKTPAH